MAWRMPREREREGSGGCEGGKWFVANWGGVSGGLVGR